MMRKKSETKLKRYLASIYYDVNKPESFGGIDKLYIKAKVKFPRVKRHHIIKWLSSQDAYTKFKPRRNKFARNKMYCTTLDEIWQSDLNYMGSMARYNNGYKYILTVIDCFSRYAFIEPLKNKKPSSIVEAFKSIFAKSNRVPYNLQTDKGGEFTGKVFQTFLKNKNITFYTTQNDDTKAFLVERFNRTLKSKMWKYFERKKSQKWINIIEKLTKSYNNSIHRSIGRTPASVTESNVRQVWRKQFSYNTPGIKKNPQFKFNINDKVRISKGNYKTFKKGFQQQWSSETFIVTQRLKRQPHVYGIEDVDGDRIKGVFYASELQKVR